MIMDGTVPRTHSLENKVEVGISLDIFKFHKGILHNVVCTFSEEYTSLEDDNGRVELAEVKGGAG
jgi:hypothetical protein